MTDLTTSRFDRSVARPSRPAVWRLPDYPVAVFWVLSLVVGLLLIAVTPPLRGPDESQHFLRAYGIATGDLAPMTLDERGHKGLRLPQNIQADFAVFDALPSKRPNVNFQDVWAEYTRTRAERAPAADPDATVFVAYAGAEGYSPVGYLPYVAGALLARGIGLDFVATLYLMRLFGLLAFTALTAYALALLPALRWAFVAIAMLPAAAYARAVVSADAAALGATMVIVAMVLRAAMGLKRDWRQRMMWYAVCALTKPPHLAFILLEPMTRPARAALRRWRGSLLIVLPAVILALGWSMISSADVAAWRLTDLTGVPTEQFGPMWKLGYMLEQPLHFPRALVAALGNAAELWRQLIGVLGLFDTELMSWVYPMLSALVLLTFAAPMPLPANQRRWIAIVAAAVTLAYVFTVFFIFYLVWTPAEAEQIWGVQGRYFLPVLPTLAIVVACLSGRGLPAGALATGAIAAALLSGVASAEGILRFDWGLF